MFGGFKRNVFSPVLILSSFRFLFDNKSQDHVYYRWKLFSILQVCFWKNFSIKNNCFFRFRSRVYVFFFFFFCLPVRERLPQSGGQQIFVCSEEARCGGPLSWTATAKAWRWRIRFLLRRNWRKGSLERSKSTHSLLSSFWVFFFKY